MKNAIILHGRPGREEYYDPAVSSPSNNHWLAWLQRQLLLHDILAQAPELPRPYDPVYEEWVREFERFDITPETILVGHSRGGGFIVRWLSENKQVRVGRVVLVAPSPSALEDDLDEKKHFFDYKLDPNIASRTKGLIIFKSDNDRSGIMESIKWLEASLKNAKFREFKNYGHFTLKDMGTQEFPELLEACLN